MKLKSLACPVCGKTIEIEITEAQYEKLKNGELMQNVFPKLSPAIRERFITGYCEECWDKIFDEGF